MSDYGRMKFDIHTMKQEFKQSSGLLYLWAFCASCKYTVFIPKNVRIMASVPPISCCSLESIGKP